MPSMLETGRNFWTKPQALMGLTHSSSLFFFHLTCLECFYVFLTNFKECLKIMAAQYFIYIGHDIFICDYPDSCFNHF